MRLDKLGVALTIGLVLAGGVAQNAFATFHLWQISEVFSSADGTVQFVELQTTADGQGLLTGVVLATTNATGGAHSSLQFASDLSGSTANKTVLIATQTFASLTGLTPDYVIADGFLPTAGGAVNFGAGVSVLSYTRNQLPRNGVQSLGADLAAATASPVNFAGLTATLAAPVNASFDTTASILNLPVVDVPGTGVANVSFDVDLQALRFVLRNDFFLYDNGIVAGDKAAQLQSGDILFVPTLPMGTQLYAFKLAILGDNPITFGNPTEIVITDIVPTPEPDPQPSELQQSITRGETAYAAICAECHGSTGEGGASAFGFAPNLRVSGFDTFSALQSRIDQTMPRPTTSSCRDSSSSTCATDTANFILNVFQQSQSSPESVAIDSY